MTQDNLILADLREQWAAAADETERKTVLAGAIERLAPADAGAPNPIEAMLAAPAGGEADALAPSLAGFADRPIPDPVIWRDDPAAQFAGGAVLSVGEVALFASAGGLGKSAVTLALALAAADAAVRGKASGAACGLRVRAGPVLFANYEDSPVRMAHRLRWLAGGAAIPEAVRALPDPGPLYEADPDQGGAAKPGPAWSQLALAAKLIRPALIVADPASAALAGAGNDSGAVRAFMRALARLADASGAGVLIVAHDTKGARNEARAGGDPGAGAVAGSATWYDAARGVLYMRRDPDNHDCRLVECLKANHGAARWGARLGERFEGREFVGLELRDRLAPDAMAGAIKPAKDDGAKGSRVKPGMDGSGGFAPGKVGP